MNGDPYVYPGSNVLRNLPDIRDYGILEAYERKAVVNRIDEGVPTGTFDLKHLQAIHKHLFQDVYPWAGEIRTVQISKGDCAFMPTRFIETGMADITARLRERDFLKMMERRSFVKEAATIIGDVNHIHPFREGNGRTQMQYLQQLARKAGHALEVRRIEPRLWIDASIASNGGDYSTMVKALHKAVVARERSLEVRRMMLESRSAGRGRGM